MSCANIFSQSLACLLIPSMLSFTEQKFLILMKPSLSILSFRDNAFGIVYKRSLPCPRSSRFSLMLSPRSFKILHFIFRSLIHFELIFVKDGRSVSGFRFSLVFFCFNF